MKLETFRIRNCFGFGDSGEVNLSDARDLIYILGKNSSGKSSLLNSIRAFAKGEIPQEMPNFKNFDETDEQAKLEAVFRFNETDIDPTKFENSFRSFLKSKTMDENSIKAHAPNGALVDQVIKIYNELIIKVNLERSCRVVKYPDGDYLFHVGSSDQPGASRVETTTNLIKQAKDANGNFMTQGAWRQLAITAYSFENILFDQFPKIALFNRRFSLSDDLPNNIKRDWANNANSLTKYFINYLGAETITALLDAKVPAKVNSLQTDINEKAGRLVSRINKAAGKNSKGKLLGINILFVNDGLQITLYTDNKPSYYSQLSDNTKFLFAYHLHQAALEIKGNVLLFDEPSNGFHPTAQKQLLNFLQSLASGGNQVVVSTHSEYLIDTDFLSGVRIMGADREKKLRVRNRFYNSGGKGDYFALQPIYDAIGHRFAGQIDVKDKIVICEGVTDMLYILAFSKILGRTQPNLAPARGDGQIAHLLSFMIAQGFRCKILIDKGEVREKLQKDYGIPDENIHEIPPQSGQQRSGIEDLFSKSDFEKLLSNNRILTTGLEQTSNSNFIRGLKDAGIKRIVAHSFLENAIKAQKQDFDRGTLTSFEELFSFCENPDWFSI